MTPGANDNASGSATAISLAAVLDADPPANLDVWVVLAGAGNVNRRACAPSFVLPQALRPRADHLPRARHGWPGEVRYETAAGWIVGYGMDPRLIELARRSRSRTRTASASPPSRCASAAARGRDAGANRRLPRARDHLRRRGGYVPHLHLATDLPEAIDRGALDRAHGFALDLIRQLDRDTRPTCLACTVTATNPEIVQRRA